MPYKQSGQKKISQLYGANYLFGKCRYKERMAHGAEIQNRRRKQVMPAGNSEPLLKEENGKKK